MNKMGNQNIIRKEIKWINTLKVLCMLIIYLNHSEIYCGTTIGLLRNLYLPLFVPAFFLLVDICCL